MNRNRGALLLFTACSPIGGQAVMDGVMMRNGDVYGLAVRNASGAIIGQRLPWRTFLTRRWRRLPFIRGFPILLETLVNGIHALNRSAVLADSAQQTDRLALCISVGMAFLLALALFIATPHLLSLAMQWLGLGGDVADFTFHIWDGFYKCAIFLAYIWLISFVPDIRRVFEYHGAEHKVIHAWETGTGIEANAAFYMSRLHPRCGTTFLLFVIVLSIILQAVIVPFCLHLWSPPGVFALHLWSLAIKLALIVPVSAAAYEMIRFAADLPQGFWRNILQTPGLLLQKLTTREPTREQLQVAIVALAEALDSEDAVFVHPAEYEHIENSLDTGSSACLLP